MRFARIKNTKEELSASDGRARRLSAAWALICPVCKEPVALRSGKIYASHFAHRSNRADPECENYHPAFVTTTTSSKRRDPNSTPADPTPLEAYGFGEPGLFLRPLEHSLFELTLKLPSAFNTPNWSGEIRITTPVGERAIRRNDLKSSTYVPVALFDGVIRMSTQGTIDQDYWNLLTGELPRLNDRRNVFQSGLLRGRLLPARTPLYWGEKYWVLLRKSKRHPRGEPQVLGISEFNLGNDWSVLEVQLPHQWDELGTLQRTDVSNWFERAVLPPTARLHLLSPFPVRIDEDGVFEVPKEYPEIKVYVTQEAYLTAVDERGNEQLVERLSTNVFSIRNVSDHEYKLYLDGSLALVVRSIEIPFFRPKGVTLSDARERCELFESELVTRLLGFLSDRIDVTFPSEQAIECVTVNGDIWPGLHLIRDLLKESNREIIIDGGAFGYVRLVSQSRSRMHAVKNPPKRLTDQIAFLTYVANNVSGETITWPRPTSSERPDWLKRLLSSRWDVKYAAHVWSLFRQLKEEGYT